MNLPIYTLDYYVENPDLIFELKDELLLNLAKAVRVPRRISVPEETLSNPVYSPTNRDVVCSPYVESKRISKGERECKRVLESIYKRTFHHVRPDFISNKRNLELDCFCPSLGIACEYHGKQHYIYPSRYIKKKALFINQLRRDLYKMAMCRKVGIYLIIVPHTIKEKDIEAYIRERLPQE
ncbi:Helicase [Cedratvirus A11]|uniref:Helicase n=1 Tax=Cedratvirus A11 TaxID=1903266 RepID=A0A1M7XTT2_9VIRU|nr:Helicase [Cedratvirus A11]SHO33087.1 Helicase [Cedratvirus A11]